jgi:uncharacterized protein YkwD
LCATGERLILDRVGGYVAKLLCLVALAAAISSVQTAGGATTRPPQNVPKLATGVLKQLNAIRASNKLVPLVLNAQLSAAALQHSKEMLARGYFSHDSFDGSSFQKRVKHYYRKRIIGENLVWSTPNLGAARALALWMGNAEHRAAILDPRWREIGIGAVHSAAAPGKFNRLPTTVVTTDFGA